jgi:hypothetical protein
MPERQSPYLPDSVLQRPEFIQACHARDLGRILKIAQKWTGFTYSLMSRQCEMSVNSVSDYINGRRQAQSLDVFTRVANGLHIPGVMLGLERQAWEQTGHMTPHELPSRSVPTLATSSDQGESVDDEADALELARRVSASDVGDETVSRLESVFDELAVAYSVTPPQELISRVRTHLGYVAKLLDARKTLDQHRRVLTVGGWLSLLAATLHIDLKQHAAATARLRTASTLATHAEHDEIHAWCLETSAWRVLTEGDYPRAVKLAQAAQRIAPPTSSALAQATAQEGRAYARLRQGPETYSAMNRVRSLAAALPELDSPGHHYRYDPDKLTAYSATTLAWLGDPAAETYARELLANLQPTDGAGKWPRRVASANLDLALTLLTTDRLDEAAASARSAVSSGHVAPSNYWRALEVVRAVEERNLPEAADLREAYENLQSSHQGERATIRRTAP